MFNNNVFSSLTIEGMSETPPLKPSMELLYATARLQDINTPAAVARKMGATQQVLKNWDYRGISKAGAMKAQKCFGLDANALLALDTPPVVLTRYSNTAELHIKPLVTADPPAKAYIRKESRDQWTQEAMRIMSELKPAQREGAVATLRTYVHNLGPPEKRTPPASDTAAA